jgi:type VI secretion system protein ImpD
LLTGLTALIERCTLLIDDMINQQINHLLHHPAFQRLEAAWRGLLMLVAQAGENQQVKIRLLDLAYHELAGDLLNAMAFDQSELFQKIYANEFDHAGGAPYGLLVGDYYFAHRHEQPSRDDVSVLSAMAQLAAAAFAPFIGGVSPRLFGVDALDELPPMMAVETIFKQAEYTRWQSLRQDEDTRFIGLAMPRFLIRLPYNQSGERMVHRFFQETVCQREDYLWGNASFAYASVVISAFMRHGWFAQTRGINAKTRTGGVVAGIPRAYFKTDSHKIAPKITTEVAFSDTQEKRLSQLGLLVLRDHPLTNLSVFYGSQSLHRPLKYDKASVTASAKISSLLHYLLCASRFAHYVKVVMREKVGRFMSPEACEAYIRQWLLHYCAESHDQHRQGQARFPLRSVNVEVRARRSMAGGYTCLLQLQPHYQLDNIQSYLRLVTYLKAN